jgi:ribonucleoside-diphosphate reductase alpha chain
MDSFATAVSVALQYGVPLKDLVNKFSHLRFEPAGFTGNPEIPMAKSLVDYIFRYLATKFLSADEKDAVGIISQQMRLADVPAGSGEATSGTTIPPVGGTAAPAVAQPQPASAPTRPAEGVTPAASSSTAEEALGAQEPAVGKGSILDGLRIVAQNGGAKRSERLEAGQPTVIFDTADSPACTECGSIMVRNGSCYKCINCGATSGCS